MKNIITLFAVVFALGLGAQSLELVSHHDTVYYDPNVPFLDVPSHIGIKNISSVSGDYKVRRNGPFANLCKTNYFCWDQCYLTSTDVSAESITIPSSVTSNDFSGHIESSGTGVEGCCEIDYTFFNANDATDTLRVKAVFCGTNSISINENVYSAFSVFPNPASNNINIEYIGQKDGKFEMFNVIGQSVHTETLYTGQQKTTVDVSSFTSGVYFYTLQIDGKVMETKKLIIK